MNFFFIIILISLQFSCNQSEKKDSVLDSNTKTHKSVSDSLSIDKKNENTINIQKGINAEKLLFIKALNTKIGEINDKDGYSNLRYKPNVTSKIITKIRTGKYFFFNQKEPEDWAIVKDLNENVGYIHNSRIKEVKEKEVFSISMMYSTFNQKEKFKDTIVLFKDLENYFSANFQGSSFNGGEINRLSLNDSLVVFSDDRTEVKISKSKFIPSKHKIETEKKQHKYFEKIDGEDIWGTDGNMPNFKISSIKVKEGNSLFQLSEINLKNLFEPNLDYTIVNRTNDGKLIISMMNSDGARGYCVVFIIKNNKLLKRITYIPF